MDAQKYMLHCLELAQKASDEDEVPIGAAVVDPESGEIVSEAYNLSEHKLDATAHAETLAIRRACEKLGVNRLRGLEAQKTEAENLQIVQLVRSMRLTPQELTAMLAGGGIPGIAPMPADYEEQEDNADEE